MEFSIHGGTPKSSVLKGFSLRNHPFWSSLWKTPYYQNVRVSQNTGGIKNEALETEKQKPDGVENSI